MVARNADVPSSTFRSQRKRPARWNRALMEISKERWNHHMGFAIRNLRDDLTPKILCEWCHSTIDVADDGDVFFENGEPYATKLRFYHKGKPCSPDDAPPEWKHLDLKAFLVHFIQRFSKPEVRRTVPFRL